MKKRITYGAATLLIMVLAYLVFVPDRGHAPSDNGPSTVKQQSAPPQKVKANFVKINNMNRINEAKMKLDNSTHVVTIHHNNKSKSHYMKREVTVKFKKSLSSREVRVICREISAQIKNVHQSTYTFQSKTLSTRQLITYFKKRKDVDYAEPNFLLLSHTTVPDDTLYYQYQWNMPMMDMERAWDISKGSSNVVVATVDTGIDYDHPEFNGKITQGYNVLNGSSQPQDDNGHGTHVAGIIGAKTNNREGVAGVSWNSNIMPVKGIGADGSGSSLDIAKGIVWATDHGASVINMSIGNYHPSQALHDAIRYAYSKNVVLVAASGNDNTSQPSYPAAYPEVLSVGAVDVGGKRADFSNYGSYLDIMAPGVNIPSTYIHSDYAALSGTSMACPHVTGVAALIRSVNPGLSNRDVMNIIQNSADELGSTGWDPYYGYGLINVSHALQLAGANQNQTPVQIINQADSGPILILYTELRSRLSR